MPGQSRRQVSEVSALDLISHPLSGQPFGSSLDLCLCLVVLVWALSLVTGDCSKWLDRLWALTPPACCLALVLTGGFDAVRVNVMTALAFLWAARMTFNFVRKGGYRKSYRDYRWESLKERIGPLRYRLLSIVLFTPSQLLLPWLFTSPVHQAWVWKSQPLGWLDGLALLLFLAGFCGESISDQQMWAFQQDKKRRGCRRGEGCPALHHYGPVSLQPPSVIPVRDRDVVCIQSICGIRIRAVAALDRSRHSAGCRCSSSELSA